jgi:phospholipid transport system substrate-binding protein
MTIPICRPLAILTALFLLARWCPAEPATAPEPRALIEQGSKEILTALRDQSLTPAERGKKVSQLAGDRIDFDTLSKLALGPTWNDLTDAQRADFMKEFERHVRAVLARLTEEYTNEEVAIVGDREEARGDRTIQTHITGKAKKEGAPPRDVGKVDFRFRQKDGQWKVIDVTIAGVSLANGFRGQFQAVMKNGGFERLMEILRQRAAAGEKDGKADRSSNPAK